MTEFYKVLKLDENHNGYQFSTGLHVDTNPWNITRECSKGGFYFCKFEDILKWLNLYTDTHWIRPVTIPEDALVYSESNGKVKANKIILGERISIKDFLSLHNLYLAAVKESLASLRFIQEKTPDIILAIVEKDGSYLRSVNELTPELCLVAVKNNGMSLQFIPAEKQTSEICMIAVLQNGYALQFVKKQTYAICLAAVKVYGRALQYVKHQTDEICLAAVKQNPMVFEFIKNPTKEMIDIAGQQNIYALQPTPKYPGL